MGACKGRTSRRTLNHREQSVQAELSRESSADLEHIVDTMTSQCHPDTTVVALSGGVESTTMLFTMLRLGFKPAIMSWVGGSGRMIQKKYEFSRSHPGSSDFMRAKTIADTYGLTFIPFVADFSDPEDYAEHCIKTPVTSRPSFEVSYLYKQMAQHAASLGYTTMFSGMGEGNLQGSGRKISSRGAAGQLNAYDLLSNHASIMSADADQLFAVSTLCAQQGIDLMLPYAVWGSILRFAGMPWHVMNTPRPKWITASAFSDEYEHVGYLPYTAPMQSRDASSRPDFDALIAASATVKDTVGNSGNITQLWYNHCIRLHTPHESQYDTSGSEGVAIDPSVDIRTSEAMLDALWECQGHLLKLAAKAAQNGSQRLCNAYLNLFPYVLRENTLIVAAGKAQTDRSGAMRLLDSHDSAVDYGTCNIPPDIPWWDGETIDASIFMSEACGLS